MEGTEGRIKCPTESKTRCQKTWEKVKDFQSLILCHQTGEGSSLISGHPGLPGLCLGQPLSLSQGHSSLHCAQKTMAQIQGGFKIILIFVSFIQRLISSFYIHSMFIEHQSVPSGNLASTCYEEGVYICINLFGQLVSFPKSGFQLENTCYSDPFLKAVS